MPSPDAIGIGLFGFNGHQVHRQVAAQARTRLIATGGVAADARPAEAVGDTVTHYDSLEAMLDDPRVTLVSLCSPRRADQADHAVQCLEAGKHVYAEKPCALSDTDLDRIVATAERTGKLFHEMAGTAMAQPYRTMRQVVREGRIGEVVQVFAQKSYPYHDRRPQDEAVDGGLVTQAGVHAVRMVEHVGGKRAEHVTALDTKLGNHAGPKDAGELRMAASLNLRLEGGAIASVIANYLNQSGTKVWGNEVLRIFGTQGFVESVAGGQTTRLVVGDEASELPIVEPSLDYFDLFLDEIAGRAMPFTLDEELHPTRVVIRARAAAQQAG